MSDRTGFYRKTRWGILILFRILLYEQSHNQSIVNQSSNKIFDSLMKWNIQSNIREKSGPEFRLFWGHHKTIKFLTPILLLKISPKETTFIFPQKNKKQKTDFLAKRKYSKKSVVYSFLFFYRSILQKQLYNEKYFFAFLYLID